MIDEKVTGQARQPGRKGSLRRAKRFDGPKYAEKDLLRQVLGFRTAVREPVAEPVHSAGVQPHQLFPGGFIAGKTTRDEADIQVQASFYQIARTTNSHRKCPFRGPEISEG